jgi:hypothetical protein
MVKLERLAHLAKKKTLFDDRPVEIQELTFVSLSIFRLLAWARLTQADHKTGSGSPDTVPRPPQRNMPEGTPESLDPKRVESSRLRPGREARKERDCHAE